jgi:glutamate dehydrogenase (NAD(P)+)
VSGEDGYRRYHDFLRRPPLLSIEWHDDATAAVGVLVINSLRGGAAGGGTRLLDFRREAGAGGASAVGPAKVRAEALFLAKTMEIKFGVAGPAIGGAKSVLCFDPDDPRKREVLRRWFRAIAPYLKLCYGTGGDVNVDELEDAIPLAREAAGVAHPQEGVVVGHLGATAERKARILENLRRGLEAPVALPGLPGPAFKVADLVTGFGVAEAAAAYASGLGEDLAGRRVLVEGFGNVGGPAAYYLHAAGARVVGVLCKEGPDFLWATDPGGLDVPALLAARRQGRVLPVSCCRGPSPDAFWSTPADCFVPAALSHTVRPAILDRLRAAGVTLLVCGANNPFAEEERGDLALQRRADAELAVIPDFVANCGAARAFAYLMSESASLEPEAVFADVRRTVHGAVGRLLAGGPLRTGLLERALATFVPAP